MEKNRAEKLQRCGLIIQKLIRGWLYRNRYRKLQAATYALQRYGRGMLARRKANYLRQTRAAVTIQTHWRRFVTRRRFLLIKELVLRLQCEARRYLARAKALHLRKIKATIVIQRYWRGYAQRLIYHEHMRKIILVQCCIRRYLAKRSLRKLKTEARSIEHVKQLNKGLENKIIELQQKIGDMSKSTQLNAKLQTQFNQLKADNEALKTYESEYKQTLNKLNQLQSNFLILETKLKSEVEEKVDLVNQKSRLEAQIEAITRQRAADEEKLVGMENQAEEVKQINQQLINLQNELINSEKERDSEREAYQGMIKKLGEAEAKIVTLEQQVILMLYFTFNKSNIQITKINVLIFTVMLTLGQEGNKCSGIEILCSR